jgi:methionine sulfoxide reductase heme-binding subunit
LLGFTYVSLHLLVWLVLDVGILSQIWADILKRPYITIGMAGFACLLPLAATSNNYSIRKLGAKWRKLHRLTYLAVVLGAVHFIWLVKGFQIEPLLYMAAILALLALRAVKRR